MQVNLISTQFSFLCCLFVSQKVLTKQYTSGDQFYCHCPHQFIVVRFKLSSTQTEMKTSKAQISCSCTETVLTSRFPSFRLPVYDCTTSASCYGYCTKTRIALCLLIINSSLALVAAQCPFLSLSLSVCECLPKRVLKGAKFRDYLEKL